MQITQSDHLCDPEWDHFVGSHPFGHHEQTSSFARVRAQSGFKCVRVMLRTDSAIVAGAQILYNRVLGCATLGQISQGPVVSPHDAPIVDVLMRAIDRVANRLDLTRLRISSYAAQDAFARSLAELGFRRSGYRWAPEHTSLVDLSLSEEQILAKMHRKARYNIRLAARKGVEVAAGNEADIPALHRLLSATAARQGFPVLPEDYFREVWHRFAPAEKVRLLLARYEGTPLSAVLLVVAGDRALYGWGGRSDEHRQRMPNYALHWAGIRWAKDQGCATYDFSGVSSDPADSVSTFKRRLGAVASFPDPHDKFYGPLGRLRRRVWHQLWDRRSLRTRLEILNDRICGELAY
jgi:lipid II:glycine glycyltransferase (peptidoglycan interpeptide bridge formation enzyme)